MTDGKAIVIIGGGAAGLIAAGRAAECGASVTLLEKTSRLGQKLLISGKTRCNLTNSAPLEEFLAAYGPNGRFLQGPFRRFFRDELLGLLRRWGVDTKTERGGRVFPTSDDAADVVSALERYARKSGARIRLNCPVTGIQVTDGRATGVRLEHDFLPASAVVLATGGASYPNTGSTGDGYALCAGLGHTIVPLRPALVPLVVEEVALAKSMQGVSLRNVRLTAFACRADDIDPAWMPTKDVLSRGVAAHRRATGPGGRASRPPIIESRLGEMMLTHFGIGGPVTLLMSLPIVDALAKGPVSVAIDLKPGLTEPQLRARLQRDFAEHGKRGFRRILEELLPRKMIDPYIALCGIPHDKPGNQITADERERVLHFLKSLRFNIRTSLPLNTAIVTAGGVSLKQIDPRTMQSRVVRGLFLCGEVVDLDADTGGYNLQAAFTTGYIAGENAAS